MVEVYSADKYQAHREEREPGGQDDVGGNGVAGAGRDGAWVGGEVRGCWGGEMERERVVCRRPASSASRSVLRCWVIASLIVSSPIPSVRCTSSRLNVCPACPVSW